MVSRRRSPTSPDRPDGSWIRPGRRPRAGGEGRRAREATRSRGEALSYIDSLYGTALRLTRRPADAEDLVQDTYLKAFRSSAQFQRGTNLKAWLFTILHNTFRNMRRHDGRNPIDVDSELVEQAAADSSHEFTPEQLLTRASLDADLQAALDALPEAFRQAVWLRDVEELSYAEIAGVLDVPIGTVMSRISRGRRALYDRLALRLEPGRGRRAPAHVDRSRRRASEKLKMGEIQSGAPAMSKCQDLEPLLAPYVDGDAPAASARPSRRISTGARRAATASPDSARSARSSWRAGAVLRGCASEHLRARCAAHCRCRAPVLRRVAAPHAWVPLSLAATLVLAVAGAFMLGLNNQVEALAAQLTLDHLMCFQFAPERAAHADSGEAGRAWAAAQGWALQVPASSAAAQLELLGVRRCSMSGKHASRTSSTSGAASPSRSSSSRSACAGARPTRWLRSSGTRR